MGERRQEMQKRVGSGWLVSVTYWMVHMYLQYIKYHFILCLKGLLVCAHAAVGSLGMLCAGAGDGHGNETHLATFFYASTSTSAFPPSRGAPQQSPRRCSTRICCTLCRSLSKILRAASTLGTGLQRRGRGKGEGVRAWEGKIADAGESERKCEGRRMRGRG